MTVRELTTRMDLDEFQAWRVYDAMWPIGAERADRQAALISSVIANVNRNPKTKPDPFTIDDFDLYREKPATRQLTREEEEARFEAAFQAFEQGLPHQHP